MCFCSVSRTTCTSHITTGTSTLTCNVETDDSEDDEDVEKDTIEEIKAWWGIRRYAHVQSWMNWPVMLCSFVHSYPDLNRKFGKKCLESSGNTINFTDLSLVIIIEVTLGLKSGHTVTKSIDLKKIGKSQLWAQTRIPVFPRKTSRVLAVTNFWMHVLLPL